MASKDQKPSPDPTPAQAGQVHTKLAMSNPKGMDPNYRSETRGKGQK
jgi:hypothetical protein